MGSVFSVVSLFVVFPLAISLSFYFRQSMNRLICPQSNYIFINDLKQMLPSQNEAHASYHITVLDTKLLLIYVLYLKANEVQQRKITNCTFSIVFFSLKCVGTRFTNCHSDSISSFSFRFIQK